MYIMTSNAQKISNRKWVENNREHIAQSAREWRIKNPEKHKANIKKYRKNNKKKIYEAMRTHLLKTKYSITQQEYDEILFKQDHCCAICKKVSINKKLSIDHNHETGKIRGLLCTSCNMGLGYFKDNIQLLMRAINYL